MTNRIVARSKLIVGYRPAACYNIKIFLMEFGLQNKITNWR